MSNEIRILGCPVLPLDKGLEEDGVTFGICHVPRLGKRTLERYSKSPFSFVDADQMFRDARLRSAHIQLPLAFLFSTSTIEQIRKDLESGAYRL